MLGLDYSGGRPSGAAVARAGYGFVVRYLPNGLLSRRVNLSAAEVADMHAAGVQVAMVWESAANRAAGGRGDGIADATMAAAQAKVVGLDGQPIYFAVDFDLPDYSPAATSPRAKLGPVGDYFDAVVSVLGVSRVGVYGGYWAVRRCLDAGLASWAWQTAAWSGGNVDTRIHLFQRIGTVVVDGVACDENEARQDDFGQQGDAMTAEELLDLPINRAGSETGATSLRQVVAWFDADLNGLKAALTKVVNDRLDAIEAKFAAATTLTIDYDQLGASTAKHIHLTATATAGGDQPPATT